MNRKSSKVEKCNVYFHFQGVINLLKSEIQFFGCTKSYEYS